MSLSTQLQALAQAVGADIKTLLARVGNPANLTTADKTSLVNALNEVRAAVAAASGINDAAPSSTSTYSSSKIDAQISAAVSALVDGAPAALNTLLELANELTAQDGLIDGLVGAVANRVRVDAAQGLTAEQQATARGNIGAASAADLGDPAADPVAAYTAAKA